MKIGLIGYGKMGKAIEEIALDRGHEVVFRANSSQPIDSDMLAIADVAIEFTKPLLAVEHIEKALHANTPIVVGTTGWNSKLTEVTELVNRNNGTLLYASNFSIGVNIFFELNRTLAKLMLNHPEYKIEVEEIHHVQKLDAPSGTAVSLLNDILIENKNYSEKIGFTYKEKKVYLVKFSVPLLLLDKTDNDVINLLIISLNFSLIKKLMKKKLYLLLLKIFLNYMNKYFIKYLKKEILILIDLY
jgi:4-hydroxy-tetrahydrodipicolinate reductase